MRVKDFADLQKRLLFQARADLAAAHDEERKRLEDKIGTLNARLADPDRALAEQQAIITSLEEKLARQGNHLGGDAIIEAKAALEAGDFIKARDLFDTLAAETAPNVHTHADASFALGQIAEAEIRWHNAATHYARAARLSPGFDTLRKALEYAWRAGKFFIASAFGTELLEWAKAQGSQEQLATAVNGHALNLKAQGAYPQAEALLKQALEIGAATIGTAHPDYAIHLNNLAGVVQAQGRYGQARGHYAQALAILRDRLGDAHPNTQQSLRNILHVLTTHFPDDPQIPELQALLTPDADSAPPSPLDAQ